MKIEVGESLILSWLKHAKNCQIVQTNWKPSVSSWQLMNEDVILWLMAESNKYFEEKYGYAIYKKNCSFTQLIQQAEIDLVGIAFDRNEHYLYAIDVAFHEAGLNYGSKEETVTRIVKKTLRSAMCINGYFGYTSGDIIFASPKIHNSVLELLIPCMEEVADILHNNGLNFKIRIIANDEFEEKILQPVLAATSFVADTSELFMRSLQMYNLFADKKLPNKKTIQYTSTKINDTKKVEEIEVTDFDGLKEMKIGALVRSTLIKMFRNNEISREEVELMQTTKYSKETFDINYPLLRKASQSNGEKVLRYWAGDIEIYGERYFICSEWYEVPQNNDRPYFMKWLTLRT